MEARRTPVRRRHAQWATESMRQALRDVHTGRRNMTAAARHHGIPRQTLVDYYKESCETGEHATIMKRRGGRPDSPSDSVTSVEATPLPTCATALSAAARVDFQRTLEMTMAHLQLSPAALFAVSEVALRACGHEPEPLALTATDVPGSVAESADPLRVVACVAASGRSLTPLVVFKEDALPDELDSDASLGFHVATSKTGQVTDAIFARWMAQFVVQKPTGPVLLLVNDDRHLGSEPLTATDGEESAALRLAAEHDVAILLLPPDSADTLQPLDRVLLPSLAARYDEESRSWHGQNGARCPLRACFRHIFSTAWHQTIAPPLLVTAAFELVGLSPLDRSKPSPPGGAKSGSESEDAVNGQALRANVMAQLLRAVGHQWPPHLPPSVPVWFPRPLR